MNSLAIIVLNWNGSDDTIRCIESLTLSSVDFEIVVVDNGSTPNNLNVLENFLQSVPNATLLKNTRNKGFAGGVNTGIRHAVSRSFKYVALLNNDAIVDKDWASELLSVIKRKNAPSIVTGLLLNTHGKIIDSTAEIYSKWGIPFSRARGLPSIESPSSGLVFGATGGASLYKTSLFKEIGLFDESFFAYYEDVDISFRAQLAGHKVYFTNKAIAYHKQGATSKKVPGLVVYQTFKNLPLLYAKNVPAGLLLPIGVRLLLLYILIFGNAVKNGSGKYALGGWLASIWYFWTRALWRRVGIQSRRKVDTAYINSILWHDIPPNQTGMRKFRKFFTGKP